MEPKKSIGIYRIGFLSFSFCVTKSELYFYIGRKRGVEIGFKVSNQVCNAMSEGLREGHCCPLEEMSQTHGALAMARGGALALQGSRGSQGGSHLGRSHPISVVTVGNKPKPCRFGRFPYCLSPLPVPHIFSRFIELTPTGRNAGDQYHSRGSSQTDAPEPSRLPSAPVFMRRI